MTRQPLGVLILHGFTSSLDCVVPMQRPIVALGLPTRMPVLRGHGGASPDSLRGVRWQDWVDDAEAALQELLAEVDRAVVIGHSMGALVALILAANHAAEPALDSIIVVAPAVQMTSPLAPGRPLAFLRPIAARIKRRHSMPPVRADKSLEKYDTNYPWAPIPAVEEFLVFSCKARERLSEVTVPALIIQSRNDSTVAPESAVIVYEGIATPALDKRVVWFEETEHEMFRDCECDDVVEAVVDYVRERTEVGAEA